VEWVFAAGDNHDAVEWVFAAGDNHDPVEWVFAAGDNHDPVEWVFAAGDNHDPVEWVFAAGDNLAAMGWFNDSAGRELSLPDADHDPPSPQRAVEPATAPAVHSAARRYPTRHCAIRRTHRPAGWVLSPQPWGAAATAAAWIRLE
jgi:hypothetical protein